MRTGSTLLSINLNLNLNYYCFFFSDRSDELQVGDLILAINGIKTIGLKHEEIIDLIKTSGDLLRLDYEYNLPPWRK